MDVILDHGKISTFLINLLSPFYKEPDVSEKSAENQGENNRKQTTRTGVLTRSMVRNLLTRGIAYTVAAGIADKEYFTHSRIEEILGLQTMNSFEIFPYSDS